jgi:hypothetical protein
MWTNSQMASGYAFIIVDEREEVIATISQGKM